MPVPELASVTLLVCVSRKTAKGIGPGVLGIAASLLQFVFPISGWSSASASAAWANAAGILKTNGAYGNSTARAALAITLLGRSLVQPGPERLREQPWCSGRKQEVKGLTAPPNREAKENTEQNRKAELFELFVQLVAMLLLPCSYRG